MIQRRRKGRVWQIYHNRIFPASAHNQAYYNQLFELNLSSRNPILICTRPHPQTQMTYCQATATISVPPVELPRKLMKFSLATR